MPLEPSFEHLTFILAYLYYSLIHQNVKISFRHRQRYIFSELEDQESKITPTKNHAVQSAPKSTQPNLFNKCTMRKKRPLFST